MKIKRILLSVLMVAALLVGFCSYAFANESTPHEITIENPDANETHTFAAYQVFVGKWNPADNYLADIKWGSGVDGEALHGALQLQSAFAACNSPADIALVVSKFDNNSDELRAFAAMVDAYRTTPSDTGSGDATTPAKLNVVGDGYYYIKDVSPSLSLDTYSDYILRVEGNVTVTAKDSTVPEAEKKVKDVNDSIEGSLTGWQDSADYDIGDRVPFRLTSTIGGDYDQYSTYTLIFHDRESAGLTFDPTSVKAYADDALIDASKYTVSTSNNDGCTFEVCFANLKDVSGVTANSIIAIEYESVLNENAVIGAVGNPNLMHVEYSNNPTDSSSTGNTPDDKVIVFTYEIDIHKVDEDGNPLEGAQFKLEKWIEDSTHADGGYWITVPQAANSSSSAVGGKILTVNGSPVTYITDPVSNIRYLSFIGIGNTGVQETIIIEASKVENASAAEIAAGLGCRAYKVNPDGTVVPTDSTWYYGVESVTREAVSDDSATFAWQGIDDGHYRLTETQAPGGYNTLDPIEFDVTADHEILSDDPQLLALVGTGPIVFENIGGILHSTVVNERGALLPYTGGIGTTIYYVIGGFLVLAAGILLVIKKLMKRSAE